MSRRKKNLRAFLYQNPDATIEQAWDSAWEGAQKHYHSKTMNELQQQLAVIAEYFDGYAGHIPPEVRAAALSKENSDE